MYLPGTIKRWGLFLVVPILLFFTSSVGAVEKSLLDRLREIRLNFIRANMELALTPDLDKCKCYDNIMLLERKNVEILDQLDSVIISLGGSKDLTVQEEEQLDHIPGVMKYD